MKPFSQACANNQDPILQVLQRVFADRRNVLEVGSGTGQHAVYFAHNLPHLQWYTSDLPANHPGINLWIDEHPRENLHRPRLLDVFDPHWPLSGMDAVFTANTFHIMPWEAVTAFFTGVVGVLETGLLAVYGPFNYEGDYTSESNARFDTWLKAQAQHQAIRDFEKVDALARSVDFTLVEDNPMPANNRLLVWRRG
ncbi:DUF938 domain-containing protein [Exilibacterium tricleocarpae]|uniref:DUF938 domain-containing protein n=1 Tax=Exilibacterium tricleocarpae TaxID=2591008 RepID=A0A545TZG0_9GAMM|nr:DUF938 domain-containing protein [Exilibacterium tricleocarpae]TQV82598.1 DUF938 domain-containing protein [Exilibacterium tricleocarpae]